MKVFQAIKPTILVVDDTPANLALIASILRDDYRVKAANHGSKALEIVQQDPPDLILLDIVMPDLDGYEVCRRLKAESVWSSIPLIFLTSKSDVADEERGLELGAVDYITRPISARILQSRVKAHIAESWQRRTLQINNTFLEFEISQRTRQMVALQNVTTLALASLAETRDTDTGNHLRRTQHYVLELARQLQGHPRFNETLTDARLQVLFKCAPLHDIGKVGIPDRVLLKPGRYNDEEFAVMKQHPWLGYRALAQAQSGTEAAGGSAFLEVAMEIVYSHHEKWDGSGYPQGLAGDAIPVSARLMAVADVYDALISPRVYKPGLPHEAAVAIILQGRGSHFDPDVVDAFAAVAECFREIAARFAEDHLPSGSGLASQTDAG